MDTTEATIIAAVIGAIAIIVAAIISRQKKEVETKNYIAILPTTNIRNDHFYTTSIKEKDNAMSTHGYVDEGTLCYLLKERIEGSIPLFRFYNLKNTDHYYTAARNAKKKYEKIYDYEGVVEYIYLERITDTFPLYKLWNKQLGDHFYTIYECEKDNMVGSGYKLQKIEGYVYKKKIERTIPLYRLYKSG